MSLVDSSVDLIKIAVSVGITAGLILLGINEYTTSSSVVKNNEEALVDQSIEWQLADIESLNGAKLTKAEVLDVYRKYSSRGLTFWKFGYYEPTGIGVNAFKVSESGAVIATGDSDSYKLENRISNGAIAADATGQVTNGADTLSKLDDAFYECKLAYRLDGSVTGIGFRQIGELNASSALTEIRKKLNTLDGFTASDDNGTVAAIDKVVELAKKATQYQQENERLKAREITLSSTVDSSGMISAIKAHSNVDDRVNDESKVFSGFKKLIITGMDSSTVHVVTVSSSSFKFDGANFPTVARDDGSVVQTIEKNEEGLVYEVTVNGSGGVTITNTTEHNGGSTVNDYLYCIEIK